MAKLPDDTVRQMRERITNVLTVLNGYRARNLDNPRIESMMAQLERIDQVLIDGGWFTHQELREMDFHQIEGTPLEGNTAFERELQSIKNFVENKQ